ncbi:conserved hypothetical protein [Microsporum canis CBS 113480]|uniref:Uncharacterized protein n=1 Tax=Arthroderma otae (strain ATCC MYA-4605 / CBS 113480) TaxID=554155 RepID=C5FU18_ARTOC|nr:conserved hypothetical protein [Microsporum canis CBS 113480]EEQ33402.1 conserved hypothetical protein [Microsporum canis CBS 113480]
MPLVVPQVSENDKAAWAAKLMGKKITDSESNETCFAKKDLPEGHRVLKPGDMTTMDFNPERWSSRFGSSNRELCRLNVYVGEDGTVMDVKHG